MVQQQTLPFPWAHIFQLCRVGVGCCTSWIGTSELAPVAQNPFRFSVNRFFWINIQPPLKKNDENMFIPILNSSEYVSKFTWIVYCFNCQVSMIFFQFFIKYSRGFENIFIFRRIRSWNDQILICFLQWWLNIYSKGYSHWILATERWFSDSTFFWYSEP